MSIILIIDRNDTYRGEENIFYIHPSRIGMLKHVQKNTFTSCQIKNSPLESLTPLNLVTVLDKLIPTGKMEIELDQPISVMQNYDAKQVESNAKLAGFDNIEINENKIECFKPEKKKLSSGEIETVNIIQQSSNKGGKTITTRNTTTSIRKYGKK